MTFAPNGRILFYQWSSKFQAEPDEAGIIGDKKMYNVIGMSNEVISAHEKAAAAFSAIDCEKLRWGKRNGYLPRTVVRGDNYHYPQHSTIAIGDDVIEKRVIDTIETYSGDELDIYGYFAGDGSRVE
ncbi:hypothetical protein [Candidatus Methylobacter oryzae]|uniref:Uncharacterized protein n=1 Tax=Candidatus Methylobacter oryzae TaxID=2497749 RepID=A0ABY3CCJ5_9GAMM|nr:hypothetical protein [Candidatus Methylobacter oryzae]TRW98988.1 hypothetical protein EKO24_006830 [Candidatus Methylobacter oryzae]